MTIRIFQYALSHYALFLTNPSAKQCFEWLASPGNEKAIEAMYEHVSNAATSLAGATGVPKISHFASAMISDLPEFLSLYSTASSVAAAIDAAFPAAA